MDNDLVTVREFAELYRVDESEVRRWVKGGHIPYELVGARKLRRIRRSMIERPIGPVLIDPNERVLSSAETDMLANKLEEFNGHGTQSGPSNSPADRVRPEEHGTGRVEANKETARGDRGTARGSGTSKGRR